MDDNKHPRAVFISFNLHSGSTIVINAHSIETIEPYEGVLYSKIYTYYSREPEGNTYVVHGSPDSIKFNLEKAIKDSER